MRIRNCFCFLGIAFAVAALSSNAQTNSQNNATPPPSAPVQRSAADLEKLVAPIALYPDPLIATILPASVYPLEIVQAARFVKDTNNIAKLDQQPWDDNVKAIAHFPDVIAKMNDDIAWTSDLGQAFLDQQQDVMNTVQSMREKARKAGTLKTTPQQTVVVTNTIVEKTVEQQLVYVTNTIVQIQPTQPDVIYVPTYDPWAVYYPPPVYVGPPPVVTFAVGIAVGAIIANNCDWHGGGIYVGPHGAAVWGGGGWGHTDVDIDVDRNVNINNDIDINNRKPQNQKWQPDQNRLRSSGAPNTAKSMDSRGWTPPAGQGGAQTGGSLSQNRPAQPSSANRPAPSPSANRPAPSPNVNRPTPDVQRPAPAAAPAAQRDSAFGGVNNGARENAYSQRGATSRGGGGGGGRGGGGRR